MPKFTLTEKILLALSCGIDETALTYRPFTYLTRLFPQVNPATLRVLSDGLVEKGSVDKIERAGRILVGITDLGRKQLVGKPKTPQAGNGEIHLVILSVPEKERPLRQQIRSLLERYNYRLLHPGLWFSPVKNEELVDQLKLKKLLEYVMLLEAKNNLAFINLVISAWGLDKLQKSYEKYLTESSALQKMTHFDTARYINLLEWQEFLLLAMRSDPILPDDFLKLSVLRKKCWLTFQLLSQKRML